MGLSWGRGETGGERGESVDRALPGPNAGEYLPSFLEALRFNDGSSVALGMTRNYVELPRRAAGVRRRCRLSGNALVTSGSTGEVSRVCVTAKQCLYSSPAVLDCLWLPKGCFSSNSYHDCPIWFPPLARDLADTVHSRVQNPDYKRRCLPVFRFVQISLFSTDASVLVIYAVRCAK